MRKFLILFTVLAVSLGSSAVVLAEEIIEEIIVVAPARTITFKDVPASHWAASAIYDLVRMGVTRGYPDGTFRGNNKISRYETAVFLSKLAGSIGAEDLKADIKILKDEVASLKKGGLSALTGSFQSNWDFANILATSNAGRGAVANYRLKLSSVKELGEGASVAVNLDTMDYGFFNDGASTGVLIPDLVDIESNIMLDLNALGLSSPVGLRLTYGPGAKEHAADPTNVLPGEVGVVYSRPDTGIMAATKLWGTDVAGGYIVKQIEASGRVRVSEVTGSVSYGFEGLPLVNNLKVAANGSWISSGMFSSSERDLRAAIALTAPLSDKIEAGGTLGLGGSGSKNMMVAGAVALNDVWDTGTVATIKIAKIGSEFISTNPTFSGPEFDLAGLDMFDRALVNGTVSLGGELVQMVSEDLRLVGKGDVRLSGDYQYNDPSGRLTAQGGISYALAPNTNLDATYRVYQSRAANDTSDLAALGLLYSF